MKRYTWRSGVAATGLALSTAWYRPAQAQSGDTGFDLGAYLSYTFGSAPGAIGWGLEARGHRGYWDGCSPRSELFTAGLLRFGWIGWNQPRLVVAAQVGSIFAQTYAANGEIGLGYRWGPSRGLEAVVGGELDRSAGNLQFKFDLPRTEATLAAGARLPGLGFINCVVGRPLRSSEGLASLPRLNFVGEAHANTLAPELRDAVVATWSQRAQTEWASVPAFVQLARQLLACGAPMELIEEALAAADDEARHAVLSAGVASTYDGATVSLDALSAETRPVLSGQSGLVRLAVESWLDGCLGEGAAAACACAEAATLAKLAATPLLLSTQTSIATDEARHAELAWSVLQWALAAGGDEVRHAVELARQVAPVVEDTGTSEVDLSRYGCLAAVARAQVVARHREVALQRLDTFLES